MVQRATAEFGLILASAMQALYYKVRGIPTKFEVGKRLEGHKVGESETIKEYIERFNKEALNVRVLEDKV